MSASMHGSERTFRVVFFVLSAALTVFVLASALLLLPDLAALVGDAVASRWGRLAAFATVTVAAIATAMRVLRGRAHPDTP